MTIEPYGTIGELSGHIRAKRVSPVEVVDVCLARLEVLQERFNAFITVTADDARDLAREAASDVTAGRWRGALHGVPVAIKDFYDTAGVRTTAGFEPFGNRVPTADAWVVERLRDAGAIVIGKTNMDALGMATTGLTSYFGPVKNPWSADHIAGGSSSGSAVAVATGMCYATLDTDAIGSCRLPAACCGVVGLKATYGRVRTDGILRGEAAPDETIQWFSHAGITTRCAGDAAIVLEVVADRPAGAAPAVTPGLDLTSPLRIGAATNSKADAQVAAGFAKAVEALAQAGHTIVNVAVPFAGPERGLRQIERDRAAISTDLFSDIDVVVLPTTTTIVPVVSAAAQNPRSLSAENTAFANYYGIPAISLPCGFDSGGLPLGFQVVGRPCGELDVLRVATHYERVTGWSKRHPAL